MMNLPATLAVRIKSGDLRGLKVVAYLYRNKWNAETATFETQTDPLDITPMLVKAGTLSTKLDVGEINEYTASNISLTLSDPNNHFVEETPQSYFPAGYQLFGSRVSIYYGADENALTPLFHGVIRTLPNYTPEQYQLSLTLVSALELLDDVEAKGFSDAYTAETLALDHQDEGKGPVYKTAHTGVGGFNAVYADGQKLFEGVDYKISQTNEMNTPAQVEIINEDYYSATITADYYVWKRAEFINDIINGLLDVANWKGGRDIKEVSWNSLVREQVGIIPSYTLGYYADGAAQLKYNWLNCRGTSWADTTARDENCYVRKSIFPKNWETEFTIRLDDLSGATSGFNASYAIGNNPYEDSYYKLRNGLVIVCLRRDTVDSRNIQIGVGKVVNGYINYLFYTPVYNGVRYMEIPCKVRKVGENWSVFLNGNLAASFTQNIEVDTDTMYGSRHQRWSNFGQVWRELDGQGNSIGPDITSPSVLSNVNVISEKSMWGSISANLQGEGQYGLTVFFSDDGTHFDAGHNYDLNSNLSSNSPYMYFKLSVNSLAPNTFDVQNLRLYLLRFSIKVDFVNLSGQTVLDVIKDLSLISGYEFGVNRENVFFFRPRTTNTAPIYVLDEKELVKIDTVKREINNLATKLTLNFAEIPLEFYADTGARPTPVDRYGVINREIDKPQLINYDNPELAQAIGPQLLAVYATLSNTVTCTGKLNLSLELGDVVNLQREMPLTVPPDFADYTKYERLNTFYRACKIIGLNYDFQKRQVKYTLLDVSNKNNAPEKEFYQYQTVFPTPLDYKE